MNIHCVFCINDINEATNRYVIDKSTKVGAEACVLLQDLPFTVKFTPKSAENSENSYLCKDCFRELKKRQNIIRKLKCCDARLGILRCENACKKRKITCCEYVNANASDSHRQRSSQTSTPLKAGHTLSVRTNVALSPIGKPNCRLLPPRSTEIREPTEQRQSGVKASDSVSYCCSTIYLYYMYKPIPYGDHTSLRKQTIFCGNKTKDRLFSQPTTIPNLNLFCQAIPYRACHNLQLTFMTYECLW